MDSLTEWPGKVGFQQVSLDLGSESQSKKESCKWRGYIKERDPAGFFTFLLCRKHVQKLSWHLCTLVHKSWQINSDLGSTLSQSTSIKVHCSFAFFTCIYILFLWWLHWDPCHKIMDIILGLTHSIQSLCSNTVLKPKKQNNKVTHWKTWFKNFIKFGIQWDNIAALLTALSSMGVNVIYEISKSVTNFILWRIEFQGIQNSKYAIYKQIKYLMLICTFSFIHIIFNAGLM